ncbi:nitronate monooxygenase [Modicisalibacter ilicicola DSM 19980]|uniref:Nitronate monooxygenase n=1 Tax=Modicisalibacter ilicicola DSM 19980 TaxID=1121942 RepID=A0A1M4WKI2_9GAMM|nr:nitronate monooxygenase [Halomonas ilicicola]SHE81697.1 nitronate monooxygenase [Halomonas ilicicola DSM 19980]
MTAVNPTDWRDTSLSRLLKTRLPIMATGLQWLANADYVAAAVNSGMMGFITAASFADTAALRDEIQRCRELLGTRAFGVNVSMLPKLLPGDRTEEIMALIADERIAVVETSGRDPTAYVAALKASGCRVVHKVPQLRHALKAEAAGVDAVTLVGAECGGHPGESPVGTLVQGALAARALRIPFALGGGIACGEQIVAALALGAAGVAIGTRFLVADEIPAHADYKQRLVEAQPGDTTLILSSVRNSMRVLRNDTTATVQALEGDGVNDIQQLLPYVRGTLGKAAYASGDWRQGALSAGQGVGLMTRSASLAEIIAELEQEADTALARLGIGDGGV